LIPTGAEKALPASICAQWGYSRKKMGTFFRGTAISAVRVSSATNSVRSMPSAPGGLSGHELEWKFRMGQTIQRMKNPCTGILMLAHFFFVKDEQEKLENMPNVSLTVESDFNKR
jgi:hypothetical protein